MESRLARVAVPVLSPTPEAEEPDESEEHDEQEGKAKNVRLASTKSVETKAIR